MIFLSNKIKLWKNLKTLKLKTLKLKTLKLKTLNFKLKT